MGCSQGKEKEKKSKSTLRIRNQKAKYKTEQKVVFLGDAGVGKSSIAQRYCYNKFSETYDVTIGGVYHRNTVTVKSGQQITLHLWDTGGEERFRAMAPLYYRDADAAIMVYDVKNAKSFESLNFWLTELDSKVKNEGLILGLAGNKCDIPEDQREVSKEEGEQFAKQNNLLFFETSAITQEGIAPLFNQVAEQYYEKKIKPHVEQN